MSQPAGGNDRSENFIRYVVAEFETALRMMMRDKQTMHAFDFEGTKDGVTELWSFLIVAAPKSQLEPFEKAMGVVRSAPLGQQ